MLPASSVFRREVDDLFGRFFGDAAGNGNGGMTRRDDLEVVVHQGSLRIWGERKSTEDNRNYWYNERNFGRFERLITLPDAVNSETIEAEMRDGILSVKLMKRPEAQPKKIAIKVD
jgi:HSP20 family protein